MEAFLKDEGIKGDSLKLCNQFYQSLSKKKLEVDESFDQSWAEEPGKEYSDFETEKSNKSEESKMEWETYYSLADKSSNGMKAHHWS